MIHRHGRGFQKTCGLETQSRNGMVFAGVPRGVRLFLQTFNSYTWDATSKGELTFSGLLPNPRTLALLEGRWVERVKALAPFFLRAQHMYLTISPRNP
jgi:hypothetical protein